MAGSIRDLYLPLELFSWSHYKMIYPKQITDPLNPHWIHSWLYSMLFSVMMLNIRQLLRLRLLCMWMYLHLYYKKVLLIIVIVLCLCACLCMCTRLCLRVCVLTCNNERCAGDPNFPFPCRNEIFHNHFYNIFPLALVGDKLQTPVSRYTRS